MSQAQEEISVDENNSADKGMLRKKIKLEHKSISERLQKKYPDINIKKHKIQKFLLIFQELIMLSNAEKNTKRGFSGQCDIHNFNPTATDSKTARRHRISGIPKG